MFPIYKKNDFCNYNLYILRLSYFPFQWKASVKILIPKLGDPPNPPMTPLFLPTYTYVYFHYLLNSARN